MIKLRQFKTDQRASTFMELAFTLPILVMMVMGGTELSFFMLKHQKMNRVAMSTADLIAQARQVTQVDIDNIFSAIELVSGETDFNQNGVVVITSVTRSGTNPPAIRWQSFSNNSYTAASKIGSGADSLATLPPEIQLDAGDGVIVAEVFFRHRPVLYDPVMSEREIYHVAFYRPRFGALTEIVVPEGG